MNDEQENNHIDYRTREGRALRAQRNGTEQVAGLKRGEIMGRNGEVLSRKRKSGLDPFHIPPEIVPKGWSYQWNVISVVGNTDVVMDQVGNMYENGWRAVPADRHPGMFVARGRTGDIVRGGLRLEERPLEMTLQARAEEEASAKQQMRDRDQSLMGGKANLRGAMRDGFSMEGRYRGTGGNLRMSIDPGLDIPVPQHQVTQED